MSTEKTIDGQVVIVPGILDLLPAVMADVGSVGKDQETKGGARFKFRGIDDALNAIQPALIKHGVSLSPVVEESTIERTEFQKDGKRAVQSHATVRLRLQFYAPDGTCISAVAVGEGLDYGDKALSKAMSIAMKYALYFGLCIPVDAEALDDPDAQTPQHEAPPQEQKPPKGNPDADEMKSKDLLQAYGDRLLACKHKDEVEKIVKEMVDLENQMRPDHHAELVKVYKKALKKVGTDGGS